MQLVRNARGHAHFRGLETCRRVWFCPVCSARISFDRSRALTDQLTAWLAAGGAAWFLTLTFPHDYGDPLALTARLASKAFTAVVQGRAWKEDRAQYDVIGFVRALEVTIGPSGWHPHLHVLLFLKKPRGVRARRALQRRVTARFSRKIVRAGLRDPDPRNCPLELVSTSEIGAYVAKASGAARELTAWHIKEGRGASRTPFQLLADLHESATDADLGRWREWEDVMRGKRQLTYSRGLRMRLDELAAKASTSEACEVLAAGADDSDETALISDPLWRHLLARPGLDRALLAAYAKAGYSGAYAWLRDVLAENSSLGRLDSHFFVRASAVAA